MMASSRAEARSSMASSSHDNVGRLSMFYPIPPSFELFRLVSDHVVLSGPQLGPSDDIPRVLVLPLSYSHEHPPRSRTTHS